MNVCQAFLHKPGIGGVPSRRKSSEVIGEPSGQSLSRCVPLRPCTYQLSADEYRFHPAAVDAEDRRSYVFPGTNAGPTPRLPGRLWQVEKGLSLRLG